MKTAVGNLKVSVGKLNSLSPVLFKATTPLTTWVHWQALGLELIPRI